MNDTDAAKATNYQPSPSRLLWVSQNRTYTPYMTVYLVIFLPIYTPYIYGSGQPKAGVMEIPTLSLLLLLLLLCWYRLVAAYGADAFRGELS